MFLNFINDFRAVATLLVVFNHCIPLLDWNNNTQSERLLGIIFFNGALLFTFISGFLFQHLAYKFHYKKYLTTRFKLVVCPYLIISIPAVLGWTFVYEKVGIRIPADFYEWSAAARILYFYAT